MATSFETKDDKISGHGNSLGVKMLTLDVIKARQQDLKKNRVAKLCRSSQEDTPLLEMLEQMNTARHFSASQSDCMSARTSMARLRACVRV
jgi:hypothetical protein